MGFYAPAQLVRDAQEHGVRVRPVDALRSDWDCTLEPDAGSAGGLALRLGLRMVQGLSKEMAERLTKVRPAWSAEHFPPAPGRTYDAPTGADALPQTARRAAPGLPSRSPGHPSHAPDRANGAQDGGEAPSQPARRPDRGALELPAETPPGRGSGHLPHAPDRRDGALARLAHRAGLDRAALERLAGADAFCGLGLDRRAALWEAAAFEPPAVLSADVHEPDALLPAATAGEQTVLDYAGTSLTLRHHPLALLRPILAAQGLADTRALNSARRGVRLRLPGLVLVRQRPGSAKGVVFFTVEDEWGTANLVVYADLVRRFRAAVVSARLVVAEGRVERTEAEVPIVHLIVQRLFDRSDLLFGLAALDSPEAGPWTRALARADEVEKPDLRDGPRAPAVQPGLPSRAPYPVLRVSRICLRAWGTSQGAIPWRHAASPLGLGHPSRPMTCPTRSACCWKAAASGARRWPRAGRLGWRCARLSSPRTRPPPSTLSTRCCGRPRP